MQLIRGTFKYYFKNFFYLLAGCVFPAIVWGFFNGRSNIFQFLLNYPKIEIENLGTIIDSVMNLRFLSEVYPFVLFMAAFTVCASLLYAAIEYHLRVGKFSFKNPFGKINSCIVSLIGITLLIYFSLLFFEFILCCILFLSHLVFSSMQSYPNVFAVIAAYVITVLWFMLLGEYLALFLFYIPTRMVFGYPFRDAFAFSIRLTGKKHWSLLSSVLLPVALIFVANVFINYLPAPAFPFGNLLQSLVFLLVINYYITLSMCGWFTLTGSERKDNKKIYYLR